MSAPQRSPSDASGTADILIEQCARDLGISVLSEWDVLTFLYRHRTSLTSAEQIAKFLGYGKGIVAGALDRLESEGLINRSRASLGVRLYRFATHADACRQICFEQLMELAGNRPGRLLLMRTLRPPDGLNRTGHHDGLHLA